MSGAVIVLVLAALLTLASPSTTGIHLDLRLDGAVPKNEAVFPLPYNARKDRSAEADNGFYATPDVPLLPFNSHKQKSKRLAHKLKYPSQMQENQEVPVTNSEQADEFTGPLYMPDIMATAFNPKVIITGPNRDDFPLGELTVEGERPIDEFMEQTFGSGLELLQLRQKLQKLDFYFSFLGIVHQDCRQRMLCEVLKEPGRFYPLSGVLEDATSFYGNFRSLSSHIANTTEGTRLISYMEAALRAQEGHSCATYKYRCPFPTEDMINYDSLCLWSEMVRWLTIHVVASKSQWNLQPFSPRSFTPWV